MLLAVMVIACVDDKFSNPNSNKFQIGDNVKGDVKVTGICHITGNDSGLAHRNCSINFKLINTILVMQESKPIIHLDVNNLYGCAMPKVLATRQLKQRDPKEFELNKYTSNSSKGCVLEADLEYPKEFRKLHNDHPLAPDKI